MSAHTKGDMKTQRLRALVPVFVLTAAGCGAAGGILGGGDSNPTGPSGTIAAFIKIQTHTGSFSLTLAGKTISSAGDHQFNVPAGTHEVIGQLTLGPASASEPDALAILLHGAEGIDTGRLGGPVRDSLRSLEGPNPRIDGCDLAYRRTGTAPETITVKFTFDVAASSTNKC